MSFFDFPDDDCLEYHFFRMSECDDAVNAILARIQNGGTDFEDILKDFDEEERKYIIKEVNQSL